MGNKLSELSKPVDICNWKMDSWRAAPCNGTEWAKGYFEGWNKYHQKVEGLAPLYSQEYVSALLAEIERGNGYLDDVRYAKGCCENAIAVREKRIAELEAIATDYAGKFQKAQDAAKHLIIMNDRAQAEIAHLKASLATPVRLPNKNDDEFWFDGVFQVAKFDRSVERSISAVGFTFTVEGGGE